MQAGLSLLVPDPSLEEAKAIVRSYSVPAHSHASRPRAHWPVSPSEQGERRGATSATRCRLIKPRSDHRGGAESYRVRPFLGRTSHSYTSCRSAPEPETC